MKQPDSFRLRGLQIRSFMNRYNMPNLPGAKLCLIIQVNKNEIHSYNNGVP